MLTIEEVKTWQAFDGDTDGFVRTRPARQEPEVSDEEWHLIEGLVRDQHLADSGLATAEFAADFHKRLVELTADEPTRQLIKLLSGRFGRNDQRRD
jgi:hypothetical protein